VTNRTDVRILADGERRRQWAPASALDVPLPKSGPSASGQKL